MYVYSWIILPSSRDWHNTINQLWKWKPLSPVRLFVTPWTICPWTTPGQNTRVGSHSLLQRIFPTQELNPGLLHCHSSVLAWRIPGTAEPGGLPSMGSHRVGYDWSDLTAAAAAPALQADFCQLSHKGSPRILEWVAHFFSSRSSWLRNWTGVSCIAGGFFTN